MRILVIITSIALILCHATAYSATTYSAADEGDGTCAVDNVQAAVNKADNGDTVVIPNGSCTWDKSLIIVKGITLQGSGTTVITGNVGTSTWLIIWTLDESARTANSDVVITNATWDMNSNSNFLKLANDTTTTMSNMRIYNNTISNLIMGTNQPLKFIGPIFGVIYNNTFTGEPHFDLYGAGDGEDTWNTPPEGANTPYAFATVNNIYIEDNTFTTQNALCTCGLGGRVVYRYNTINLQTKNISPIWDSHGNMGVGGNWGCMGMELYGNLLNDPTTKLAKMSSPRGGKQMQFYNKAVRSGSSSNYMIIREEYDDASNETTNTQPAHLSDTYFWSNLLTSGYMRAYEEYDCCSAIAENTDWFKDAEGSFDGTSGVGCGTLAARPACDSGCSIGVGYWVPAAGQEGSCTDLTGYVGTNPTKIEGTLYKLTADGEWTSYYTPYTYPHPLRTDESPPSLTVTVTNTGSGHSASHDGARTVLTGGTLTFTDGVYNGWKTAIAGTCGCTSSPCTITPDADCTITCTSSEIQVIW